MNNQTGTDIFKYSFNQTYEWFWIQITTYMKHFEYFELYVWDTHTHTQFISMLKDEISNQKFRMFVWKPIRKIEKSLKGWTQKCLVMFMH